MTNDLVEQLNILLQDDDLTDEKLREASEGLLPAIADMLNKKGKKYVSRSVYASLQAEKIALLKDIELMCMGGAEGGSVWQKWRNHFRVRYDITNMLRDSIEQDHYHVPLKNGGHATFPNAPDKETIDAVNMAAELARTKFKKHKSK